MKSDKQDIGGEISTPLNAVQNLGFTWKKILKEKVTWKKVCASCYGSLKLIWKVRKAIDTETCIAVSEWSDLVNYCNSRQLKITPGGIVVLYVCAMYTLKYQECHSELIPFQHL